jgi:D-lactate dehydrogenase (cytochrome)
MEGAVRTGHHDDSNWEFRSRDRVARRSDDRCVNRYSHLSHPVKPTLFFEFHGTSETGVREHATSVQEIAAEHGAGEFQWATTTEARTKLWQARHNTLYAARAMRPGGKSFVTDVCVPISTAGECILETKQDLAASQAFAPLSDMSVTVTFI